MNSTIDVMLSMFGAVHDSPPLQRRMFIFFTPLSGSVKPVHHVVIVSALEEYSTFCNVEGFLVILFYVLYAVSCVDIQTQFVNLVLN